MYQRGGELKTKNNNQETPKKKKKNGPVKWETTRTRYKGKINPAPLQSVQDLRMYGCYGPAK